MSLVISIPQQRRTIQASLKGRYMTRYSFQCIGPLFRVISAHNFRNDQRADDLQSFTALSLPPREVDDMSQAYDVTHCFLVFCWTEETSHKTVVFRTLPASADSRLIFQTQTAHNMTLDSSLVFDRQTTDVSARSFPIQVLEHIRPLLSQDCKDCHCRIVLCLCQARLW